MGRGFFRAARMPGGVNVVALETVEISLLGSNDGLTSGWLEGHSARQDPDSLTGPRLIDRTQTH